METAKKTAYALVCKKHALPMGNMVLVKTELCGSKKNPPVVAEKEQHARVVCDSELRAAMPRNGPMHLPYDDVLDISMYMDQEIANEDNILCSTMVF